MSYQLTKRQLDLARLAASEGTPQNERAAAALALARDIDKSVKDSDVASEERAQSFGDDGDGTDLVDLVGRVVDRAKRDPDFVIQLLLKLGVM